MRTGLRRGPEVSRLRIPPRLRVDSAGVASIAILHGEVSLQGAENRGFFPRPCPGARLVPGWVSST